MRDGRHGKGEQRAMMHVVGLSRTSWDMIQQMRRADQAHSGTTDATRTERGFTPIRIGSIRRSADVSTGGNGLPVKPSATPSQVRILDLPPPAQTACGLGFLRGSRAVVRCVIFGHRWSGDVAAPRWLRTYRGRIRGRGSGSPNRLFSWKRRSSGLAEGRKTPGRSPGRPWVWPTHGPRDAPSRAGCQALPRPGR
jgi:hypothetical protein